MMLAPLAESCLATERPMPSDEPVMRTVLRSLLVRSKSSRWLTAYLALDGHLVFAKETHCGYKKNRNETRE